MKTLLAVIQLLPALIQAVKQVEEFIPIPGQGKAKLEMILGVIDDTYEDARAIMPTIAKVVARIVSLANATGVFRKAE